MKSGMKGAKMRTGTGIKTIVKGKKNRTKRQTTNGIVDTFTGQIFATERQLRRYLKKLERCAARKQYGKAEE